MTVPTSSRSLSPSQPGAEATAVQPQSQHSPSDGATAVRGVSAKVAALEIRIEGSDVTVLLTCSICCGDCRVEKPGYRVDSTCGECKGKGERRLKTTHPDFSACWEESMYGLTKAEQDAADEALTTAEEAAIDASIRERESWPFECERCHKLHDRVLSIGCIACGSKLVARMESAPADLNSALDRVAARIIPELEAAVVR